MTRGPFLSALNAHHQHADILKMEMGNMLTFHCFINYFDSKSISAILYISM